MQKCTYWNSFNNINTVITITCHQQFEEIHFGQQLTKFTPTYACLSTQKFEISSLEEPQKELK